MTGRTDPERLEPDTLLPGRFRYLPVASRTQRPTWSAEATRGGEPISVAEQAHVHA